MPFRKFKVTDKCHFRSTRVLFFGEIVSRQGVQLDPKEIYVLIDMLCPNKKQSLILSQVFWMTWENFYLPVQKFVSH